MAHTLSCFSSRFVTSSPSPLQPFSILLLPFPIHIARLTPSASYMAGVFFQLLFLFNILCITVSYFIVYQLYFFRLVVITYFPCMFRKLYCLTFISFELIFFSSFEIGELRSRREALFHSETFPS